MTARENVMVGAQAHQRRGFATRALRLPGAVAEDREAREEAGRLLRLIGIEEWAETPAADLPAGIRRLLEIARALATRPRLLLLDEPAAGLNATETRELVQTLYRVRDGGITVLVVEHDMGLVMEVSDEIVVIDRGRKIAEGPPRMIQKDPVVIAAYLGEEVETMSETPRRGSGRRRWQGRPPDLSIRAGYGKAEVLHDVDLSVGEGELVALIGANGAGKSTLLKTIVGLVPQRSGTISSAAPASAPRGPSASCADGVALVPEGRLLFGPMTVRENLELGAYALPAASGAPWPARAAQRVDELFPVLAERADQPAETLSGGEQQMLAVGRALMSRRRGCCCSTSRRSGSRPRSSPRSSRRSRCCARDGVTILLVEQDARLALKHADRGSVMRTGRVVLEGPGRRAARR